VWNYMPVFSTCPQVYPQVGSSRVLQNCSSSL